MCTLIWLTPNSTTYTPGSIAFLGPALFPSSPDPGLYWETPESWNGNKAVLGITLLLPPAVLTSSPRREGEEGWTRVRLQPVELRLAWKLLRFLVPTGAKSDT